MKDPVLLKISKHNNYAVGFNQTEVFYFGCSVFHTNLRSSGLVY